MAMQRRRLDAEMMRRSCATQKFSLCEVLVGWWGGVGGEAKLDRHSN